MLPTNELIRWANTLSPDSGVAVDDSGLSLVEIDTDGKQTGAYLELGGIPEKETEDE